MNEVDLAKRLDRLTWLAGLNLVAMLGLAMAVVFGLLPKLERAVQTSERVEERFQEFADQVQPVLVEGAGKAAEAIRGMDAERLSDSATESTDTTIRALGERAKRYLDRETP